MIVEYSPESGACLVEPFDFRMPVKQMQFMRYDGKQWNRFGEILTAN